MSRNPEPYQLEPWREELLARAFEGLPGDIESLTPALGALRQAFHSRVASVLEPAINDHVAAMPEPHNWPTYERIATVVDSTARRFGLAVTDPDTGKPAVFASRHAAGPRRVDCTFTHFVRAGRDGYNYSSSSPDFAPVKLQPAPEKFDTWAEMLRPGKPMRTR